jgi:hypothetical protein
MESKVIGPSIFEEPTVTGDTFMVMMDNATFLDVPVGTVFQSDCAPLRFSRRVPTFLDREFLNRWTGKGRPIPWPPHSPDLTLLDYFFCGFVMNFFYCEKVQNLNELPDRTVRAAECFTNEILANTCPETEYRLYVCCATNGAILRSAEHIRNFVRSTV